jgi:hypothetical protein
MARSFTRAQIRTRALFLAELDTATSFAPTTNVDDLINTHVAVTWGEIVALGPPDYVNLSQSYSTQTASSQTLPAGFYQETLVLLHDGTQRIPLTLLEDFDRGHYQAPSSTYSVTVEYVPAAPVWTAGAADTSSMVFDGLCGFEELICIRVARDLLFRGKRDLSAVMALEAAETERIAKRGGMKRGGPRYLRDVEATSRRCWSTQTITKYRIRGAGPTAGTFAYSLELYEPLVAP